MTLKEITAKVLGMDANKINGKTSRESTSEWDSFNHLLLVSEIEKEFDIKLKMDEVNTIKTFADLEKILRTHGK
ncbi:MAG: hypothetical protein A3H57_01370 [Candidatus Taylorbacteria bacterium RIFCSPLOWO2_02_FULL_43_11]|uniref:Carrier domain-containing protein n=1 Tax=Candidatus Taylorbacteria bacterium RIFCSPHIGHO2_02_FULL_43_32b TaxID=1802306 RepID=A0A1G2ML04_9BACT|nr:MAG: hypothetical protein A3C72_01795 [Candidatus Taylorbacteria bacterium RIFCSPHIGHO2_02_FULL_43_32b]OHA35826.1 MAG: hypothetical protein A3H57_01370 [Candidatus Taylorbacteria bacterium RIFCSPLOWO2_02_FULL_43_11]